MDILLIGGTGAMGVYLVNYLCDKGYNIYVTSREKRHSEKENIYYLQGDAHNEVFRKNVLQKKYFAIIDFLIYEENEFEKIVMDYLLSSNQYIFLSSARVYCESNMPISEDFPRLLDTCKNEEYLKTSEYALKKARQENILIKSGMVNWTILRPYITYSNERLQLGCYEKEMWLYRVLQGRSIVFPKDIAEHITTMSFGGDVAKVIYRLIGNPNALGQTFNIAGSKPIQWNRVLEVYQKVLQDELERPIKVCIFENSLLLAEIMHNYCQIFYDRMYDRIFDNSKIEKLLGTNIDFIQPEEGLEMCLKEFIRKKNINTKKLNAVTEAYMDILAGEYTRLGEFSSWKQKIKYIIARYTPYFKIRYKH